MDMKTLESGGLAEAAGDSDSSASDFPEAEVVWNRSDLGRADVGTPSPSLDGRDEEGEETPDGPKRYLTAKEKDALAWRCIFGVNGANSNILRIPFCMVVGG